MNELFLSIAIRQDTFKNGMSVVDQKVVQKTRIETSTCQSVSYSNICSVS